MKTRAQLDTSKVTKTDDTGLPLGNISDSEILLEMTNETYTTLQTRETTEASDYFLMKAYNLAIPVCDTSNDSLQLFAASQGDWVLPDDINDLPTCSRDVVAVLGYKILPVLKEVLVCKPIKTLSPMEYERMQDIKQRRSHATKKTFHPTSSLDLTL